MEPCEVMIFAPRTTRVVRGVDDIRYMKALEKYAGKPDVDKLHKEAAKRVEDGSFDGTVPDKIRAEVVKLIKKYQK